MEILYVTNNKYKLKHAIEYVKDLGIQIEGKALDVEEIQSQDIEKVVEHKARQAWDIIKKPLVVSDSGWEIPALNGFPGPYMADINKWFTAKDFINLMRGKNDRTIYLNHLIGAIKDGKIKIFSERTRGIIIDSPRGEGSALDQVVIMEGNKKTIAENQNIGLFSATGIELWAKVTNWFM
jgi:XTP/dITP diphosphohydrolase